MSTEQTLLTTIVAFLFTTLRLATPLTFASLGGYSSERSGTINIALEGIMLIGAFGAAAGAHFFHNYWIGIFCGIAASICFSLLHGFLCITLKSDQIISGMAINLLATGIPPVLSKAWFEMSSSTPMLETGERIPAIYSSVSPLCILAALMVFAVHLLHAHTKLGQYIRFSGEHPLALTSQGISVKKIRWISLLITGVLCGLGGVYLSIDHSSGFARNMTAGRGFIALAALIVGRWTPIGAFIGCLLFGAIEALQILLQGTALPNGMLIPVQWIQLIPYAATLFILAGFVKKKSKSYAPKALGTPF